MRKGKRPSESAVEMTEMVLPNDANPRGTVLGGKVMHLIDVAGAIAARRHCNMPVVTASVDGMQFMHSVKVGEIVIVKAQVNRAFNTSMEVGVEVFSEDTRSGERRHTSTAFLTYVATDDAGKPVPVPPVLPQTPEEKVRYEEAGVRRAARLSGERKGR